MPAGLFDGLPEGGDNNNLPPGQMDQMRDAFAKIMMAQQAQQQMQQGQMPPPGAGNGGGANAFQQMPTSPQSPVDAASMAAAGQGGPMPPSGGFTGQNVPQMPNAGASNMSIQPGGAPPGPPPPQAPPMAPPPRPQGPPIAPPQGPPPGGTPLIRTRGEAPKGGLPRNVGRMPVRA